MARVVYALFKRVEALGARTSTKWDDVVVDQIEEPIAMGIVILGFWLGYDHLHFGEGVDSFMEHVFQVLIAVDVTWMVARLLDSVVSTVILHLDERSDSSMVSQFGPILQKTLRSLVWTLGIISGLTNWLRRWRPVGVGIGGGVGHGGQRRGQHLRGDHHFRGQAVHGRRPGQGQRHRRRGEGNWHPFHPHPDVGKPVGHHPQPPVYRPSGGERRSHQKVTVVLGLTYDTTPERIEEALAILTDIVANNPKTGDHTIWFSGFGDFSLNLTAIYYIRKGEHWAHVPGEVNLAILNRFNAAELDFAFRPKRCSTKDCLGA